MPGVIGFVFLVATRATEFATMSAPVNGGPNSLAEFTTKVAILFLVLIIVRGLAIAKYIWMKLRKHLKCGNLPIGKNDISHTGWKIEVKHNVNFQVVSVLGVNARI